MNLTVETAPATHAIESRPIVANLEGVSKNYGPVRALRAVDFNVCAGELVALLGPNGAGKTTTVKLLLGLMPPHAGKVRVLGRRPDESRKPKTNRGHVPGGAGARDVAGPRTYRPILQLLPETHASPRHGAK